jgi:hypothetical protein
VHLLVGLIRRRQHTAWSAAAHVFALHMPERPPSPARLCLPRAQAAAAPGGCMHASCLQAPQLPQREAV